MTLTEPHLFNKLIGVARYLLVRIFYRKRLSTNGLGMFGSDLTFIVNSEGSVSLDKRCIIDRGCFIQSRGKLIIGTHFFLNSFGRIVCHDSITIGDNVTVASGVSILDHDHNYQLDQNTMRLHGYKSKPVVIGSNVWVGEKVTILKGVSIGSNSIIAAGAVVTQAIPERSIAAGVPAKVIGKID